MRKGDKRHLETCFNCLEFENVRDSTRRRGRGDGSTNGTAFADVSTSRLLLGASDNRWKGATHEGMD